MANSKEITAMQAYAEELRKDPVRLKKFMREVMGPPKRIIEGQEKENMLTLFRLIEPYQSTNNQRTFTDEYHHAGKTFYVHYFGDEIEVEEVLPDEES